MTATFPTETLAPLAQGKAGAPRRNRRKKSLRRGQAWTASGFLLPNLALVGLFLVFPLISAVVISFQALGALGDSQWLGFNNYIDLANNPVFREALLNTAIFTLATVPTGMAAGLGIAMLLNSVMPGRVLYRSIIFLPLVISGVSSGVLGAWMFDQYNGFINKLLHVFGLGGPQWQSGGNWAMISIILVTLWQRIGFDMLIYMAGLQGVNPELQEACTVDGATGWKRLRHITFPLLGPSTFFLLIMNLIYSFQVFDTVWAMTRGGPDFSTTTVVTYAYRTSFDEHGPQQLGYGAAVGVVIFFITLAFTAAQWRWNRQRDQTG